MTKFTFFIAFVLALIMAGLILVINLPSSPDSSQQNIEINASETFRAFNWKVYDSLLKRYVFLGEKEGVRSTLVDYAALKKEAEFHKIYSQLRVFQPAFSSRNQKLAFYINAYNYFTLKLIIDNNESQSIKNLGSLVAPVWKKEVGYIGGSAVTLNQIEHKILRSMEEPRIHFSIVCASLSCPDLRPEAYIASTLDAQLQDQAKKFINNSTKGVKLEGDVPHISSLFKWFEEDFGDITRYLNQYHESPTASPYQYISYNWNLNSQ